MVELAYSFCSTQDQLVAAKTVFSDVMSFCLDVNYC